MVPCKWKQRSCQSQILRFGQKACEELAGPGRGIEKRVHLKRYIPPSRSGKYPALDAAVTDYLADDVVQGGQ